MSRLSISIWTCMSVFLGLGVYSASLFVPTISTGTRPGYQGRGCYGAELLGCSRGGSLLA